mmetsp:Transcript_825/g.1404  ORF Transcript_825/g.1404 Transcript_825/m.1404 type:complete len:180 (+) Transcript_825:19-558(+)
MSSDYKSNNDRFTSSKSDGSGYDSGEEKSSLYNESESKNMHDGEYTDAKKTEEEDMMNLVNRIQEFFFGNEALAKTFEDFVRDRSAIIDLSSEEYRLEYTAAYNEYKNLFESNLENYIEDTLNSTPKKFYLALKHFMDKDEYSNESIFAQILVAVTDFDVFMTMMREAAREKALEYGRK